MCKNRLIENRYKDGSSEEYSKQMPQLLDLLSEKKLEKGKYQEEASRMEGMLLMVKALYND